MRIRLIKSWQFRAVGSVLDMPDGAANLIIARGFAIAHQAADEALQQPETFAKPQPRVIRSRQKTAV